MTQNTLSQGQTPRGIVGLPGEAPWNPYRVLNLVVLISVIGVGVVLGLNWKRLGKPEWVQKTLLISILLPLGGVALAVAWIWGVLQMPDPPMPALMAAPSLALGANFGFVFALARLQNGAYQKWEAEGPGSMLAYGYDIAGAARLFLIITSVFLVVCTVILPLLG